MSMRRWVSWVLRSSVRVILWARFDRSTVMWIISLDRGLLRRYRSSLSIYLCSMIHCLEIFLRIRRFLDFMTRSRWYIRLGHLRNMSAQNMLSAIENSTVIRGEDWRKNLLFRNRVNDIVLSYHSMQIIWRSSWSESHSNSRTNKK